MKLKNYAKLLGVVTLAVGLATGCTNTATTSETMASQNVQGVQKIINDAKKALSEADKAGYAWRDTESFISDAEKALAAGDTAKATSLATKALDQANLAKKQGIEQDNAVKTRFSDS